MDEDLLAVHFVAPTTEQFHELAQRVLGKGLSESLSGGLARLSGLKNED